MLSFGSKVSSTSGSSRCSANGYSNNLCVIPGRISITKTRCVYIEKGLPSGGSAFLKVFNKESATTCQ